MIINSVGHHMIAIILRWIVCSYPCDSSWNYDNHTTMSCADALCAMSHFTVRTRAIAAHASLARRAQACIGQDGREAEIIYVVKSAGRVPRTIHMVCHGVSCSCDRSIDRSTSASTAVKFLKEQGCCFKNANSSPLFLFRPKNNRQKSLLTEFSSKLG
jgi:hypothetical protein